MKILIVDDSLSYRTQISKALACLPEVGDVRTASHGHLALRRMSQDLPDVLILDMEMPEMNGLEVLQAMASRGYTAVKVIVYAGRNLQSESMMQKAQELGASDFAFKPEGQNISFENAYALVLAELGPRLQALFKNTSVAPLQPPKPPEPQRSLAGFRPDAIVIACSTGGPEALEILLKDLIRPALQPIFVAQHMPSGYTEALATRLSNLHGIECREGRHGEIAQAGLVYLAPGDFHMKLKGDSKRVSIVLDQDERVHNVRPAADFLFESAARIYGRHCMGFVLTGMGEDGKAGAAMIRRAGGKIVIQAKQSSVVWGMPGAVHATGEYDLMVEIDECAEVLARLSKGES